MEINLKNFNTREDFQNLIDSCEEDICCMSDLKKISKSLAHKLSRMKFRYEIVYKEKQKTMITIEMIQQFIDENNISSRKELHDKNVKFYSQAYKLKSMYLLKFHEIPKEDIIIDDGLPNNLDEFQKFIEDNNITSTDSFIKTSRRAYTKALKLKLTSKLFFVGEKGIRKRLLQSCNTLEEFQKFVDDNEIKGSDDFEKRFGFLYRKLRKLKLSQDIIYSRELSEVYYQNKKLYNTPDDFQKYINENNIKSPVDFLNKNPILYHRLILLHLTDKVDYGEDYYQKRLRCEYYKTRDTIQEYIDLNFIFSERELRGLHCTVFSNYSNLTNEEKSSIKFCTSIPKNKIPGLIKELEDIQDYIIKNKLCSIVDLQRSSNLLYKKSLALQEKTGKKLLFLSTRLVESNQELYLIKELVKYGITKFNTKFVIKDHISGFSRRYDILLTDLGKILEVHGPQHFTDEMRPECWVDRDETENDKLKYELARKYGYDIYYIAYDFWQVYEEYGYFQPVYHSVPDLFSSIGIEVKENPNYEQDFMNLFSDDFINLINKICKGFEIHNQEELNKFDNLSWLVSEFNLYDKIIYYKEEEQDLQEQ